MIRSVLLFFSAMAGPAGLLAQSVPASGVAPDAGPDSITASLPDSARAEMVRGRSWHAATLLAEAFPDGPGEDPELIELFARASAGWKDWPGVLEVLEGPLAAGTVEGPEAWHLLGRALEEMGRDGEAVEAFRRVGEGGDSALAREARARRALLLAEVGLHDDALDEIVGMEPGDPALSDWVFLFLARASSTDGGTEATHGALSGIESGEIRGLGWDLLARALLSAGDSTGAEAAFWSALPALESSRQRALAWLEVGRLRLARGDSLGARGALHRVLAEASPGGSGVEASEGLLILGYDSVDVALRGARTLAGAGESRKALEVFAIYRELLQATGGDPVVPASVRLSEARAELAAGRTRQALAVATELSVSEEEAVALGAFALRMQALRALGRGGEVRSVEDQLMARFPNRAETVEILFARAERHRTLGVGMRAIEGYAETIAAVSSHNLAGQARMRTAQLLEVMGRPEEAVAVYEAYMAEFPEGRRWDEAAFWAAYLLRGMGREDEAGALFADLLEQRPLSYYAVRASQLTGAPYVPVSAEVADSLPLPSAIVSGMRRFDELVRAGLAEAAVWEAEALSRRLEADPDPERRRGVLLRLAHELNARGFTREGINLGWDVRREGGPMDRHLLAAIYPFPYQPILEAEAELRRADPYLLAGLIRQESAFWVEARSRADARGLMQVLPTTGRELARSRGPRGFRADDHLYDAEINIHLGTAFFADMRRRFGEDLPIILSAYNAGPTRANRWRTFPEAKDMIRFVERIPFTETRGYVKNVLLNRAIYTWLYGSG